MRESKFLSVSAGNAHWNAMGTATRYQLDDDTTIAAGHTLDITAGVEVATWDKPYSTDDPDLVINGVVRATGIQVTGRTEYSARNGGELYVTGSTISGIAEDFIEYQAGSGGQIQYTSLGIKLSLYAGATMSVKDSDF